MLGSVVLDVAVGMSFVYLLLSLIASVVQEILATFMQLRAANLVRAVRSLVSGGTVGGIDVADLIYNHGLVRGLYSDPAVDSQTAAPATPLAKLWAAVTHWDWLREFLRRTIGISPEKPIANVSSQMLLPAYIPSKVFATALIDILNPTGATGDDAMIAIRQLLSKSAARQDPAPSDPPATQPQQQQGTGPAPAPLASPKPAAPPTKLEQMSQNAVADALLALANSADNLTKFEAALENWYNAAMDRASGWYKKYTQTLLLRIGLVLAILFNVDSIRVARAFWTDKDVRQGMVNAAGEYTKNHPNRPTDPDSTAPAPPPPPAAPAYTAAPNSATTTPASTPPPAAPAHTAAPNPTPTPPATTTPKPDDKSFNPDDLAKQLKGTVDQFNKVANDNLLPVGWKNPTVWARRRDNLQHHPITSLVNGLKWLQYSYTWQLFLGWLITAMALSLGAPFWFDNLNRFMVVRGTVKPAEKSKPEGQKDARNT